jgi:1-acyl-sn-glycerol-3-phosphate acyltransferase
MLRRWWINKEVCERVQRLELPFNEYGFDPYGISHKHLEFFLSFLGWFYHHYFSVKAYGLEHIPPRGRVMLVGNHSGGVAIDGGMVIASLFFELELPRLLQGMADKFISNLPFASEWLQRSGQFTGLPEHAIRLLEEERALLVFPEGSSGTAKLYKERYSLVRFGSGFVRLAMRARAPIVPFAFEGGGEILPTIKNLYFLGRLFGVPYIPLTPYLLPLPRPVSCNILYDKPLFFEGDGNETDDVIEEYVAQVKERIGDLLQQGRSLREKKSKKQREES